MRKTAIIFWNMCVRSRWTVVLALCCGVGLCGLFAFMTSTISAGYERIPIGLAAHEENAVTADLRSYLENELGMEVVESADSDYLDSELVDRHVAAVVEVPDGFEESLLAGSPPALDVRFLDDYANAQFVRGYLASYAESLGTLALGADGSETKLQDMLTSLHTDLVPVTTQALDPSLLVRLSHQNAFRQFMGFYVMISSLLGIASALQLLDDRQMGLYNRVKVSAVRTTSYILGTSGVGIVNAVMLIAPFFIYTSVVGLDVGVRLWQAAALCLLYSLFVVGAALLAAMYLRTKSAVIAWIISLATIMCMLGGAFFPIDTAPVLFQNLARATPQFWFMDAVLSLQNDPDSSWGLNAVAIALFALLCFILAGIRFVHRRG